MEARRSTYPPLAPLLVAVSVLCLFPCDVGAETSSPEADGEEGTVSVMEMIERADRSWQVAWNLARGSEDSRTRVLLSRARLMLERAKQARTSGNRHVAERYARAAAVLIGRADERLRSIQGPVTAQQAEEAIREATRLTGGVMHGRPPGPRPDARRRGPGGPGSPPRSEHPPPLPSEADTLLVRARRAYAAGRYDVALRLAHEAQNEVRGGPVPENTDGFLRERCIAMETLAEPMVERALQLASRAGDEEMVRVAGRAAEHLRLSREAVRPGQIQQRARMLEAALRGAERVVRELDREGFLEHRAARAIAEARAALDRAADVSEESETADDSRAEHERGTELLASAQEYAQAGEPERAIEAAEEARLVAQMLIQQSLGGVDESRLDEALARTDQLIERVSQFTSDSSEPLMQRARVRQAEAKRLRDEGELRRALAETRIAARFAQRAIGVETDHE